MQKDIYISQQQFSQATPFGHYFQHRMVNIQQPFQIQGYQMTTNQHSYHILLLE